MPTREELRILQALDYNTKNRKSDLRIHEYVRHYGEDYLAVSVSGGLDSSVLLHKVRTLYPSIIAVGIAAIECKANQKILEAIPNFTPLKPLYSQVDVIQKFGYPIGSKKISKSLRRLQNPTPKNYKSRMLALTGITSQGKASPKHKLSKRWLKFVDSEYKISEQCCYYMKEKPLADFARKQSIHYFTGLKASDGDTRETTYLTKGCNSFSETGSSNPLGFWTHNDVLMYTVLNNLPVSEIYGDIVDITTGEKVTAEDVSLMLKQGKQIELTTTKASRSGCMICAMGLHMEQQPNRFQRMEVDEPGLYNFAINTMGFGELLDFVDIPYRISQLP